MSAPAGFQLSGSAPEAYQRYDVAAIDTAKAPALVADPGFHDLHILPYQLRIHSSAGSRRSKT